MTWKSTIKKSGVDAGQLARQFKVHVMKKMMSDLESEGYGELTYFIAKYESDFQRKIHMAIEQFQKRVDDAVLNDSRFDSKTKERLQ